MTDKLQSLIAGEWRDASGAALMTMHAGAG